MIRAGRIIHVLCEAEPGSTPDPVIATIGDRLAPVVVTWDSDFETRVRRVPEGTRTRFRRLGRISFRFNEVRGRELLARWIGMIEYHYEQATARADFRMIVQIQDSGAKFM